MPILPPSVEGSTLRGSSSLLLSYICKKRVLMLDFDGPEYNALLTRKRGLAVNEDVDEHIAKFVIINDFCK